jgi:hypothetical protein
MGLFLNLIQFIFNFLSVFFVTKRFGRRPILMAGTGLMAIFSLGIGVSLIESV